jgi:hypothetical protein
MALPGLRGLFRPFPGLPWPHCLRAFPGLIVLRPLVPAPHTARLFRPLDRALKARRLDAKKKQKKQKNKKTKKQTQTQTQTKHKQKHKHKNHNSQKKTLFFEK